MTGLNLSTPTSNVVDLVEHNTMPMAFRGDALLFGTNLAAMTAWTCLGVMVVGWMVASMFAHRKVDRWNDPVSLYRFGWFCAGMGLVLRCGGAAMSLWAWDPQAARTAATVLNLQRYLDPIALLFGAGWMLILVLSYSSMVAQLRKRPYPVYMLTRVSSLKRPAAVVALSFTAAALVAWLRSQVGV